jgi:hypothetical protein
VAAMKITLDAVTNIPAGVSLRLTPEQASARSHAIEPFGKQKQVYVGTQQLCFKRGEVIEVIGDLPKGILPIYDRLIERAKPEQVDPADVLDDSGDEGAE